MSLSDEERERRKEINNAAWWKIQPFVEPGTLVMSTTCMGIAIENIVNDVGETATGWVFLTAFPTAETLRIMGRSWVEEEIFPALITHVDRVPVNALEVAGKRVETMFQLISDDPNVEIIDVADLPTCDACGQPIPDADDEVPF